MRRLGLILALFSATFFAACAAQNHRAGEIHVGIASQPGSLDSRMATDAQGIRMNRLIYNGLFKLDEKLNIVPDLAETYELSADGKVYLIHLRKGVKFHDGSELTSADVVYSYNSIIDGSLTSPFKEAFGLVTQIVAVDPYTVRFELKEPQAPFMTAMCIGVVSEKAAREKGEQFGRSPIGSGPYRFVNWVDDSTIELAAFTDSFGAKPENKKLFFDVVKDDNMRVLKLIKGDLDYTLNGVPPVLLDKVREDKNLAVQSAVGTVMAYMGTNVHDPILKSVKVRQALALGLDRDSLIQYRRYGLARKANSILPPNNWAYNSQLPQIEFDPAKAKQLLDEAGFKDPDGDGPQTRFELSFKTSTSKERIAIVEMIAEQLAKIGVAIKLESLEWGKFYEDVQGGKFQLYSLQWVGVTEPDQLYSVLDSSQTPPNGANRTAYKNAQVDDLVRKARRTNKQEERKNYYAKVQEIFLQDLPQIPLWYEDNVAVYRKDLSNVALWPDASFKPLIEVAKK